MKFFTTILLALFMLETSQAAPVGINLGAPRELINSNALIDMFKLAEGWYTSCRYDWGSKKPIDKGCTAQNSFNTREQDLLNFDKDGWVRSFANNKTFTYITKSLRFPKNFEKGRFVLDYQGDGDLKLVGGVRIISNKTNRHRTRIVFDLVNTKISLQVRIARIGRDYIKNIRIYRSKYEKDHIRTHVFSPEYIRALKKFEILRFMTWTQIRTNKAENWSESSYPKMSSYIGDLRKSGIPEVGRNGMPESLMIRLANKTQTSPWFSVPTRANDLYVRKFAEYTKAKLHKKAKIYLEYSNEMWNGIFPGTNWAKWQGMNKFRNWRKNFEARGVKQQYLKDTYLSINFYAQRTSEMCKIWKDVFGSQSHRINCILSSYVGSRQFTTETLDCPLAKEINGGETCASHVDYFAVGPYFGHYIAKLNNRKDFKAWSKNPKKGLDELFEELLYGQVLKKKNIEGQYLDSNAQVTTNPSDYVSIASQGAVQLTIDEIQISYNLASSFGVKMISYEGGQSIIRYDGVHKLRDPEIVKFIVKANKDPRMEEAYKRYLRGWGEITNNQPFLHFSGLVNGGVHPFFGIFDSTKDKTSPKWRAMNWYKNL